MKLPKKWFASPIFFKARSGNLSLATLWGDLWKPDQGPMMLKTHRVVVVGSGIAGFSVIEQLKAKGFNQLTLVTRDDYLGGKCVRFGCMPSEFFSILRGRHSVDVEKFSEIWKALDQAVRARVQGLGVPVVNESVAEVRDDTLVFEGSAQPLAFDVLVLATGNQSKTEAPQWFRSRVASAARRIEDVFEKPLSGTLLIGTDADVSVLSYADLFRTQGVDVTVRFEKKPFLFSLPSVQYWVRDLVDRGVKVVFESGTDGASPAKFDHGIWVSSRVPRLPRIDDHEVGAASIDGFRSKVRFRKNVFVVGDAAGFLSASEAELHASQFAERIAQGQIIEFEAFHELPVRLHGRTSLAWVGHPRSLLRNDWHEVDFSLLGWSLLHGTSGRAWFALNRASRKIEAIHLVHEQASELIGTAALLLAHPVDHVSWVTSSVHPSAHEIFKVIAMKARELCKTPLSADANPTRVLLPPLSSFRRQDRYRAHFTKDQFLGALLSSNPRGILEKIFRSKRSEKTEVTWHGNDGA